MTLDQVIQAERRAIITESLLPAGVTESGLPIPPYSAFPNPEVLANTPTGLRMRFPVIIETLPGRPQNETFVQICPRLNYRFLWARGDHEEYRRDYIAFLGAFHNLKIQHLPEQYHVDHLFNRARARHLFIRLILLPRSINTSHSAGYERGRTQAGIGLNRESHLIDEVGFMKLSGIASPCKDAPPTPQMIA